MRERQARAPRRVAYLSQAVDEAIARFLEDRKARSRQREAVLAEARRELANIAEAIRQGIITPTTKAMLEDAERRVAALEAAAEAERPPPKVAPLASSVERYLRDLRETWGGTPTSRASSWPGGWTGSFSAGMGRISWPRCGEI